MPVRQRSLALISVKVECSFEEILFVFNVLHFFLYRESIGSLA